MTVRITLLLMFVLLLSACGFQMRGHNGRGSEYGFHSVYVRTRAETPFITELRLNLELNKLALASSSAQADLILDVVSEVNEKQIIGLSGAGQVLEYQLRYKVSLRAYDNKENDWLYPDEIALQRSLIYDDSQVLAKEQEEATLIRDMRSDAVQQVMRRLARAKPHAKDAAVTR